MTSHFVSVEQPLQHPGVARAEQVIAYVGEARRKVSGTRALAAALLAALVAALVAVADTFVSNWADGSLLAAWMVLWAVGFLALALFAGATRSVAARAVSGWRALERRAAAARVDAQFLATARHDPRVMNDLQAAITRSQSAADMALAFVAPTAQAKPVSSAEKPRMPTLYEAMKRMNSGRYY
ncbi:MAG: hypothetical protein QM586_17070 [Xenophilus sp.]